MSGGLVSFGSYTFAVTLKEFSDNFADGVPMTVTLPGKAGGHNQDGDGPLATAMGTVNMGYTLMVDDREDMDTHRDAVKALQTAGLQKLTYQPTDPDDPVRYCWAYIHYATISQRKDLHTDLWQTISITFHVPDPHWYVDDPDVPKFDGTYEFDGTITFGEGAAVHDASGTETTLTITHNGSGVAIPLITIEPEVGDSCENPELRRLNADGIIVDRVRYRGVVAHGDILAIESRREVVTLNGASIMGGDLEYGDPAFMRLFPGVNTIKVRFKNGGDAARLRWWIKETYK